MLRTLSTKAFASISEVVMTAVVFTVSAAGILSAVTMIRPKGEDSVRKLEATYLAKATIEELRARVDARMWDDDLSGLSETGGPYSFNEGIFTITWDVEDVSAAMGVPAGSLRRLTMNVTY